MLHDIKSEKEKCKKFTEKGAYTVWSLAVVQDNFNRGDTSRNVRLMESYIVSCARDHPQVKLILFPELATTGYRLTEKVKDVAEYAEGPTFSHLSALAQKFCLYIGYGFVEKGGVVTVHFLQLYEFYRAEWEKVGDVSKNTPDPFGRTSIYTGQTVSNSRYGNGAIRSAYMLGSGFPGVVPTVGVGRRRTFC